MYKHFFADEPTDTDVISTGSLPPSVRVQSLVDEAYERFRLVNEGEVADYIPALATVPPDRFGLCVMSTSGTIFTAGNCEDAFSIQSIAKPFVFALVCQALGAREAREKIGVNGTGLPFNSVLAIELNDVRTMNPMVNAGAIATTSLVPGDSARKRWEFIQTELSRFAGRQLELDEEVYGSEAATNQRNQGIANLLDSYGWIYGDPAEATDVYTKQCSLKVDIRDLATMGATLADGGVNPITKERVVDAACCKYVLAALAIAGMYEQSGDWLYEVGLPAKSGVSGGIVSIAPGKGALGTFAPPLDESGNSVRGQLATKFLSDRLGLNMFASTWVEQGEDFGDDV